jgi:hypothetical protein
MAIDAKALLAQLAERNRKKLLRFSLNAFVQMSALCDKMVGLDEAQAAESQAMLDRAKDRIRRYISWGGATCVAVRHRGVVYVVSAAEVVTAGSFEDAEKVFAARGFEDLDAE